MEMRLLANPKRANISLTAGGNSNCYELRMNCSPNPLDRGGWEIGDRYVYANRVNRPIFSKRKSCDLMVNVQRKSEVSLEEIDAMRLSDCKIGALVFDPSGEKGFFFYSRPARFQANIFVSDELFDRLVNALLSGKRIRWIALTIERPGVLEYKHEVLGCDWDPEELRKVWKLENTTEASCVDVKSMDFGITL
jgi:hypothetical protein